VDYVRPNNQQVDRKNQILFLIQIYSYDFLEIKNEFDIIFLSTLTQITTENPITTKISIILWSTHIYVQIPVR
jgi:hypothetical protein